MVLMTLAMTRRFALCAAAFALCAGGACNKSFEVAPAKKVALNPPPTQVYTPPAALASYWKRPIPVQGPGTYKTAIENSLMPKDCGVCHPDQFNLWKGSRHSMATGPGFHAQIIERLDKKQPRLINCARCHFPLTEQFKIVPGTKRPNPAYQPALYAHGMTCAACHVRERAVYGPQGKNPKVPNAPHAGYTVRPFFQKSEFCAACHQFVKGEYSLAGKYIENTYLEWKASRYAKEGKQCQNCHMPERKHLWRGIHDKATTKDGVTIAVQGKQAWLGGDAGALAVTIKNSGVGHMFPTYVTPAVYVRFAQLDAAGKVFDGTRVARRIQRRVPLDLSSEVEDTRIPPDATRRFAYGIKRHAGAAKLHVEIEVDPDEFYRRFFQVSLEKRDKMNAAVVSNYEKALKDTFDNKYVLWSQEIGLH